MATQTLSTADAILKDLYVGPIVEQLNQKTYMIDQIERDSTHIDLYGRRAIVPVHKSRNRGRGSIADAGTLPGAGTQAWADAIIPLKYHTYSMQLSDVAIETTKSQEGAFISLLTAETKGIAQDMRKDINRQVYGQVDTNGSTGLLGVCGTTTAALIVVMRSVTDLQYIQIGDTVDILTQSTGVAITDGTARVVTARDLTNGTFTIAGNVVTTSSLHGVYISGNVNNEMPGLRHIVNSSRTLHSINSSTAGNEYWNAVVTSVGTSVTATAVAGESSFEKLADDVGSNGNGEVETFITTRGIRRRLADQYQSQKRYNDAQAVNVHGGYTAIMVNEIPVVFDDDCPKQEVFGLNKESFRWFEISGPGWLERDGGIFHLQPSSTGTSAQFNSVWLAYFKWYATLGCVAPNRNGRLKFCTDDNPSGGA